MKKITFVILFLTISIFAASAQESVEYQITGEVASIYTVNFDDGNIKKGFIHGLETLASVGVLLNFGENYETESYQRFHGFLNITELNLIDYNLLSYSSANDRIQDWETLPIFHTSADDLTGSNNFTFKPKIEAGLNFQPFYVKLDNNVSLSAERDFETGKLPDQLLLEHDILTLDSNQLSEPAGILAAGFESTLLNAEVKFCTQTTGNLDGDFTKTRSYRSGGIAFGLELSSEPIDKLTVNLGGYTSLYYIDLMRYTDVKVYSGYAANMVVEDEEEGIATKVLEVVAYEPISNENFMSLIDNPILVSLKLGYEIPLIRQMSLRPFAGFEAQMHYPYGAPTGETAYAEAEIGAGVDFIVPLPESGEEKSTGMGREFATWSGVSEDAESQGATLYVNYKHTTNLAGPGGSFNLKATFYDQLGYGSFIPIIGLSFIGVVNNLITLDSYTDNLSWGAGIFVNTMLADAFLPFIYTDFWYEHASANPAQVLSHYLDTGVGVEIEILDNAAFIVKHISGNWLNPKQSDDRIGELHAEVIIEYN